MSVLVYHEDLLLGIDIWFLRTGERKNIYIERELAGTEIASTRRGWSTQREET